MIGGAFLTTATHGTDQMMVQRYLCSRSPRQARVALLTSGVVVFLQFLLFLLIGAMLYVYYTHHDAAEAAAFTVNGRVQTDRIFPAFIVTHLPVGRGRAGDRRDLRRGDVHAVVVAQLVGGDGHGRLLHAAHGRRAARRALPARVAAG